MVELNKNELIFQFPDVHKNATCSVSFQRTLRIPDDNRAYSLPPGLGKFPIEHVEDFAKRLPKKWSKQGGVLLPMYQSEALWISFTSNHSYPFAVKIAAGKINAVTGEAWSNDLSDKPQDYLVVPDQPWLDGFCIQKGLIRQFVAMPLGKGYTAEEQLTDQAEIGGLQIIAYPMRHDYYEKITKITKNRKNLSMSYACCESSSMGLAPGGLMRQEIYEDEYGIDAWDMSASSRTFIHILNSTEWEAATGKAMPGKPTSASTYTANGLPWFEYYDDSLTALNGSKQLAGMDSVAAKTIKQEGTTLPDNEPVNPFGIKKLSPGNKLIKDGGW